MVSSHPVVTSSLVVIPPCHKKKKKKIGSCLQKWLFSHLTFPVSINRGHAVLRRCTAEHLQTKQCNFEIHRGQKWRRTDLINSHANRWTSVRPLFNKHIIGGNLQSNYQWKLVSLFFFLEYSENLQILRAASDKCFIFH